MEENYWLANNIKCKILFIELRRMVFTKQKQNKTL